MNKFFKVIAASSAVATLGLGANAAHAADATATATAQILQQISIVRNENLDFGSIVPSTTVNGTVTVLADNSDTRSCVAVTCAGTAASSAKFTVTGAPNALISYGPLNETSAVLTGPGADMPATLTHSAVTTIGAGGTADVFVGGVLTVAQNQASGTYTDTFTVDVVYQ